MIEIINNVTYYIGKNKEENFEIIDQADLDDIWFHVNEFPSCHVIASLKDVNYNKKELYKIIKYGAVLCKKYSKYASVKNLDIIYTKIKNVKKTDIIGTVETSNTKIITI